MSIANESKNNISVINEAKSGSGWYYNQNPLTYDQILDPISGMPVFYDSIGTTPVIANESKNNISVTNESKNNI